MQDFYRLETISRYRTRLFIGVASFRISFIFKPKANLFVYDVMYLGDVCHPQIL